MSRPLKADYQRLRQLSCEALWSREVPPFDQAPAPERLKSVSVVRAVGVVFSEEGNAGQKAQARCWLRGLLHDPQEKIRRYAIAALPKLGAAEREENELLGLLDQSESDREKDHLSQALQKIGGAATLRHPDISGRTLQKARANLARARQPGRVRQNGKVCALRGLQIHLHCRTGLERILHDESQTLRRRFLHCRTEPGLVALEPLADFSLSEIYLLRCFSTLAFDLGTVKSDEEIAEVIASERTQRLLRAFTEGPPRYRLEFPARGHQRGLIRHITDRVSTLCPELLNDARHASWQINVQDGPAGVSVELSPRLRPDPRFVYRDRDVPAASHPPLAAAMARLAGKMRDETVWDPFCGSGVELIECALRGGVRGVIGTDLSAEAIAGARANFAAAMGDTIPSRFLLTDFRDTRTGPVTLIISNPPMGRRVPVPNLASLIADLFEVAGRTLTPGGRLIFANPLSVFPKSRTLHREYRQEVDLGGFSAHLEKYVRR